MATVAETVASIISALQDAPDKHILFTNANSTLLVTMWATGEITYATRRDSGCVWGPPRDLTLA